MADPLLHRVTLPNGLRVLLAPDRAAPVICVSVHYDVGFRSEPEGRTGFAHLFEHLMFQGSESLEKLAHFRHVQGSGGVFNGSTHQDYTDYFQVAPSAALERMLFLEADRMRAPKITEENLRNQVDVVKEEIRLNVLNRPYGGFPWITLPELLYQSFANSHNGYGDFSHLEQATIADCAAFFDTYYSPGNAVLTVAGDFEIPQAMDLVERHFTDVPARAVPVRPSFAEPAPQSELRGEYVDTHATMPGLAVGYRLPDPQADLDSYISYVALTAVLSDGDSSRLQRRMTQQEELVVEVSARCGLLGSALDARDPDTLTVTAIHPSTVDSERVLAALDEEIERLASDGPDSDELARVTARWTAALYSDHDRLMSRTLAFGASELLFGRAELISELPSRIAAVSEEDVVTAAKALRPDSRAVLKLTAAGGDQ